METENHRAKLKGQLIDANGRIAYIYIYTASYLRLFRQHHPRNDNPNYIIQVGSVFGFIISIENVL